MKKIKGIEKTGNILLWIQLAATIVFIAVVFQMKMMPAKYIVAAGIILVAIWVVLRMVKGKLSGKKAVQWIISIISLLLCAALFLVSVMGYRYYTSTVNTLEENTSVNYETDAVSVIVLNESGYSELAELDEKTIGVNPNVDQENIANSIAEIKEQIAATYEEVEDFAELADQLYDGDVDAILVNEAYRSMLEENHEYFDYETTVIFQCEYVTEKETSETVAVEDISEGVFTVYISGIDTYGKVSTRSRSDVNMVLVVNTNTREILMISIPRDYYVELGTIGQMDKLTHSGIYGINESIATVSNLFDTDINYYYRINFSSLIKVVDELGGIDVYSDRQFVPWGDQELVIQEGVNHMDGRMALAYARERKSYAEGDNHRVQNQQDVLEAIIGKVFSLNTLMNYEKLMNSMEGSFETNMTTDEIMDFMKLLLDDAGHLNDWNIERIAATGSGQRSSTYSMPNSSLYVMNPNQDSVDEIKEMIDSVLSGETLREN